jgi:hypothetical protein
VKPNAVAANLWTANKAKFTLRLLCYFAKVLVALGRTYSKVMGTTGLTRGKQCIKLQKKCLPSTLYPGRIRTCDPKDPNSSVAGGDDTISLCRPRQHSDFFVTYMQEDLDSTGWVNL